jgi:hypothetical protein
MDGLHNATPLARVIVETVEPEQRKHTIRPRTEFRREVTIVSDGKIWDQRRQCPDGDELRS